MVAISYLKKTCYGYTFFEICSSVTITGTYDRSIDEKFRLAIPRQLRDGLEVSEGDELYLAPGNEGCVAIYSSAAFEEFAQRIAGLSPGRSDVRKFLRLFYSRAERVVLDKQLRIRIPERLLESDRGDREMVILGVHDHAEIWHRDTWDSYMNQNLPQFDELTSEALNPPHSTDTGDVPS